MNKYHNKPTTVYGIRFDSRKESERFLILQCMLHNGEITNLRRQVTFELCPAQTLPSGQKLRNIQYRADFVYEKNGKTIVEDVKGLKTREYIMKKKLMYRVHGIEVHEI